MGDILVRSIAKEAGLRGIACVTLDLAREAAQRHAAYSVAAAALGYGLTAGALLSALLKVQERVALKVEADGRLRKMVVEADAYGRLRGYVAVPDVASPPPVDRAVVSAAIGSSGVLTVVKDLRLKNLYRSVVEMASGELDRELTNYLNTSEQIPSLVELGVSIADDGGLAVAGGLLFQTIPDHQPGALEGVAARLAELPPLEDRLAAGLTPEALLTQGFGPIVHEVLEVQPLTFRCSCSRERSRQALRLLEPDDLLALLVEGEAVVDCHFCHARYEFARDEVEAILREIESAG
jgi:molecular chaperone Hsp33